MFIHTDPTTEPILVGDVWEDNDHRNAAKNGKKPRRIVITKTPTLSAPAEYEIDRVPKHLAHTIGARRRITATKLRTHYTRR